MKINPIRQRVYKVVFAGGSGAFYSAVGDVRDSEYCLQYAMDRLTRAKVGGIFCFSSFHPALVFSQGCRQSTHMQVWEAQGYGAQQCEVRLCLVDLDISMEKFWDVYPVETCLRTIPCPKGTVICRSIKLTKRIA